MKKLSVVFFAAALISVFCSCKDESSQTVNGVAIYEETPVYLENEEGKMVYASSILAGDEVKIVSSKNGPVLKKAVRKTSSGEEEVEFVKIYVDGTAYFTRPIFIADNNFIPAFVKNDTRLFTAPDVLNITKKVVSIGTIIAIEGGDAPDSDFYKCKIYNSKNFGEDYYIKKSDVNPDLRLVRIAQLGPLVNKAKNLNPVVKSELEAFLGSYGE